MLGILLVCHILVSIALTGVVLLQRSEGGALGMGGGPTGMMSARGAGDLLTRTTWILATLFFVLSISLTLLSGKSRGATSVVDRVKMNNLAPSTLNRPPAGQAPGQTAPTTPDGAPAPIQAPTPTVNNPFAGEVEPAAPTKP
ncbi:MAG: preprotein translocase subunit SecG [Alphaproteobacteria bacterium PA2]|nr:MAG: preprotein translocase subunit SecG [Alphaproteobacteria bacterium PA2]